MKILGKLQALALGLFVLTVGAHPRQARAEVDWWPLFQKSEEGMTVLYPLYVREGDFQMIFPFYYRTNQGRDTHLLWPLIKLSEGRIERVAPFWFSADDDEFTLFPLIHRDSDATITLIPPMYTRADGTQTTFVPFYSVSETKSLSRSEQSLSVLWPLWSRHVVRDAGGDPIEVHRRAFIFSQDWSFGRGRTQSILGVPVRETLN